MAPHSSTFAWKIPWMEEPGRLQSMGLLRVGHDWATSLSLFTFMHWRRKWQPTPVFLPGESQGQRSLVGCRLWDRRVGHDWIDLAVAAAAASCITVAKLRYPLASHLFPKSTEYYGQAILQRKIIFCTFYWFVTESSPILENVPQKAAFEKWACVPRAGTLTHKTNANIHTKNRIAFLQDKIQRVKSNSFFLNFSTRGSLF